MSIDSRENKHTKIPRHATRHSALLPLALTTLRLLLAPLVVTLALIKADGTVYVACLVAAFFSDIFDGVIARRYGVATASLRRYDSMADTVFYTAVVYAAWKLYPEVIRANTLGIVVLAMLEVLRYLVDFIKFKREASYHMWSAKCWGIVLFTAFVALFGFGISSWLIKAAILLGIVTDLEGLLASLILPEWTHDVPTVLHAYRIRKGKIKLV